MGTEDRRKNALLERMQVHSLRGVFTLEEIDIVEREVHLLLVMKLPQRTIAKRLNIPRTTLQLIGIGVWGERKRRQLVRAMFPQKSVAFNEWTPFERCGICGGKVKLPCWACTIRAKVALEKTIQ